MPSRMELSAWMDHLEGLSTNEHQFDDLTGFTTEQDVLILGSFSNKGAAGVPVTPIVMHVLKPGWGLQ